MTKSMKKAVTDTKNNIASTLEKCPKMAKFMLGERGPGPKKTTEKGYFRKIGGFFDFQFTK